MALISAGGKPHKKQHSKPCTPTGKKQHSRPPAHAQVVCTVKFKFKFSHKTTPSEPAPDASGCQCDLPRPFNLKLKRRVGTRTAIKYVQVDDCRHQKFKMFVETLLAL